MNNKFKKWLLPVLFAAYLTTRLFNILKIPLFTDEAIYLHWSKIFVADIHQFFISLTDGKQPLFIWLGYPFVRLISNPLLGLRLVSVFSGLLALFGIIKVTNEIFKDDRTSLLAGILYIVSPFSLIYDKMALYDSLLAAIAVWALYFEIRMARKPSVAYSLATGLIIGAGLLTKTSAQFYIYLLPLSLLASNLINKKRKKYILRWLLYAGFAVVIAESCYAILRFSPIYDYITVKNSVFVYPINEWLAHPFKYFLVNLGELSKILIGYLTVTVLLMAMMAFIIRKEYMREKVLLLLWFVFPFTVLALFGRLILARYILFMTLPLLVLAASTISYLSKKIRSQSINFLMVLGVLALMLRVDYFILFNFSRTPIPRTDRVQLIDQGFVAGVGVERTVKYFKNLQDDHVYIGTEGLFGLVPDGPQALLQNRKGVTIKGFWPIDSKPPQEVIDAAKTMPTYFIFYAPCETCGNSGGAPASWPVSVVFQIKPRTVVGSGFYLYKVSP